ncbi:MAG: hypothetical protein AUJ04_08605, partial [Acidobacteria bacterium 13_1_40CM_3_55_6]
DAQAEHHGYSARARPPVFNYRADSPVTLTAAHASFDLNHHLVFATRYRVGIFDSASGEALSRYWLRVASQRGFAIDRVSIVPDHIHLLVRIVPKMSIEECALSLLNNGQHFVSKHFPRLLVQAGIDGLWQASAFAGTRGRITTALMKKFLSGGPTQTVNVPIGKFKRSSSKLDLNTSRDRRRGYSTRTLNCSRMSRRSDLKNPPTPVGGIVMWRAAIGCRSGLNNPPTAVGGIMMWASDDLS